MGSLIENLKDYFNNTSKEQLIKDWKAISELNTIGPDVIEWAAQVKKTNKPILLPYYNQDYKTIADSSIDSNNYVLNNWWYLHGELEDRLHYDKASIINAANLDFVFYMPCFDTLNIDDDYRYKGKLSKIEYKPFILTTGIYDCIVIGIEEPCIGYFWTTEVGPIKLTYNDKLVYKGKYGLQRGLVCLQSDKKSCQYAYNKFKEKSNCL